ncbi:GNAT family N-acetyltransferase [Spirosoma oryzicola]|uniref:GNAT family N-acetyltransferase n=1 Tax=Spirosoma oryzicola TaxID=2898794 RepID=UPI001E4DEEA3|nr:GNAT family N-acetyltransferase [Spirosoma oryzicola]UHG93837.1 GNAT family N-acetyltransferase [Spirosoma oryzicola]
MPLQIVERDITPRELERMNAGFIEHGLEHGVEPFTQTRYGYALVDEERFVGCISGLTNSDTWFYITDLWLEKPYRGRGTGGTLMNLLEHKLRQLGIQYVYTWTAGYEAPPFYLKQGYEIFCEQENFYPTGHSRVGFRKSL